jgi:hypothetical protein
MAPAMELKAQLAAALGTNGLPYWRTLGDFLCARISRQEFDDILQDLINTPDLSTSSVTFSGILSDAMLQFSCTTRSCSRC